jgi:hypothetical protein
MSEKQKRVLFFGIVIIAAAWVAAAVFLEAREKRSVNNETDPKQLEFNPIDTR